MAWPARWARGTSQAFELYASGGVPAWRGRLRRRFERYNALANAVLRTLNIDMPDFDLSSLREVPWAPRRTVTPAGITPLGPGPLCTRGRGPHTAPDQRCLVARRAPSASAANLSQATLGWVSLNRTAEAANPQSAPAITFSRPTRLANRTMRSAMSAGCSTRFVV